MPSMDLYSRASSRSYVAVTVAANVYAGLEAGASGHGRPGNFAELVGFAPQTPTHVLFAISRCRSLFLLKRRIPMQTRDMLIG